MARWAASGIESVALPLSRVPAPAPASASAPDPSPDPAPAPVPPAPTPPVLLSARARLSVANSVDNHTCSVNSACVIAVDPSGSELLSCFLSVIAGVTAIVADAGGARPARVLGQGVVVVPGPEKDGGEGV